MLYEQKRIIRREKFNTIDLLVILCGLTAPIGEKMNIYFPYFSKLYVFFGAILSLFYLFGFIINKRYKISISTRTGLYFLLLYISFSILLDVLFLRINHLIYLIILRS